MITRHTHPSLVRVFGGLSLPDRFDLRSEGGMHMGPQILGSIVEHVGVRIDLNKTGEVFYSSTPGSIVNVCV